MKKLTQIFKKIFLYTSQKSSVQPIGFRAFDLRIKCSLLDEEFSIFAKSIGIDAYKWSDWHVDDYDSSLEFTGCDNDLRLTLAQQKMIWNEGFWRCWLNHEDSSETYYYRKNPNPNDEKIGT